jgi:hypothetical protein
LVVESNGTIRSACAIGMMAIGKAGSLIATEVRPVLSDLRADLMHTYADKEHKHSNAKSFSCALCKAGESLHVQITCMNDTGHKTPAEIAAELKKKGF